MPSREHQNIDVRTTREVRDERTPEERGDRSRERGRGALVNYYEDLGFATTKEAYTGWKEDEAEYSKQKEKAKSQLGQASSQLKIEESKYKEYLQQVDNELNKLGSVSSLVNKSWEDAQNKFGKIALVDRNNKVEGVYTLPPEAVNQYAINADKSGMSWRFEPNQKTVYISTYNHGRYQGEELHQSLRTTSEKVKNEYYKQITPTITKQREQTRSQLISANENITNVLNQIELKKDEIRAANYTISQTDKMRQEAIQNLRDKYEQRAAAIKEYFSGGGLSGINEEAQ